MKLLNRGAGDIVGHDAFDAFVAKRYTALVRFGYVLTGCRTGAEDLVQTALLSTFRRWATLDEPNDPTAYVRRVMVNSHISWTRRRSSREQSFAEPPESDTGPSGIDVERLHMWDQLGSLPNRMRAVLVLRFYEDLSEAETARILGCSVGTVKSQTSRGLDRLRRALGESGSAPTTAHFYAQPVAPAANTIAEGNSR